MKNKKKGQISTEYLIIVAFVLFLVLSALGIALFYSAEIKDSIRANQIESFANKVISLSESVFYSGEPARTTTTGYLPEGIDSIQILDNNIIFTYTTSNGQSVRSFTSNVNLTGTLSPSPGTKKVYINATENNVILSN